MTIQLHKRSTVLSALIGATFVGSTALAEFYRSEIAGELVQGDAVVDGFSAIADWDGPEYNWTGFLEDAGAEIDFRQTSVRFDFYEPTGAGFVFTEDQYFWTFTDVNGTMDAFDSISVSGQGSLVDWSQLEVGVLNDDQFYVDFGSLSGSPEQVIQDGNFVRLTMSFVPAPASALALLGLGLGLGGRRRRA